MKKFILGAIALILFGAFFLWQGIYVPKSSEGRGKIFEVKKGDGLLQIAGNLEKEGLIKGRMFFDLYVILRSGQGDLQAGFYSLSSSLSASAIAQKIISGEVAQVTVTAPEGFDLAQVEEELNSQFGIGISSFNLQGQRLGSYKAEFPYLVGAPESASLEGFLFPDTYHFSYGLSAEDVVKIMLGNFNKKLTSEAYAEIVRQKKTVFEVVIMASLLEKEVKSFDEKKLASGILWKRLESGMPLQVDATLLYLNDQANRRVSYLDLQRDTPYNTYRYLGLPPGPIANPGLDSILAAIYPEKSPYWYYLSTKDGKTIFSRTLVEHNIAKEKYLK